MKSTSKTLFLLAITLGSFNFALAEEEEAFLAPTPIPANTHAATNKAPGTSVSTSDCKLDLECALKSASADWERLKEKRRAAFSNAEYDTCEVNALDLQMKYVQNFLDNADSFRKIKKTFLDLKETNAYVKKINEFASHSVQVNPVKGQSEAASMTLKEIVAYVKAVNLRVEQQRDDTKRKLVLDQANEMPDPIYGVTLAQVQAALNDVIKPDLNASLDESALTPKVTVATDAFKVKVTVEVDFPVDVNSAITYTDGTHFKNSLKFKVPLESFLGSALELETLFWQNIMEWGYYLNGKPIAARVNFNEAKKIKSSSCNMSLIPQPRPQPRSEFYIPLSSFVKYDTPAENMKMLDMATGKMEASLSALHLNRRYYYYSIQYQFEFVTVNGKLMMFSPLWSNSSTGSLNYDLYPVQQFDSGKLYVDLRKLNSGWMLFYFHGNQICYLNPSGDTPPELSVKTKNCDYPLSFAE